MHPKAVTSQLRSLLFRYLDGIVTAPSAYALHQRGVTRYLIDHSVVTIGQLATVFSANEGYLNVALRVLCAQGWLEVRTDLDTHEVTYSVNAESPTAFAMFDAYRDVVLMTQYGGQFHPRKFESKPFERWYGCTQAYRKHCGLTLAPDHTVARRIQDQILTHIEGLLVAPSFVHLGMTGMFHKYFMEASFRPDEFHKDPASFTKMLDVFSEWGFFKRLSETFQFTEKGIFFAKRASAFGVTVSYLPTLRALDELIFGNPLCLQSEPAQPEKHVDREMNVWGSGGAHATYFSKVDDIVIELFNRPIHEQPKGVLDMGCGNGAFLVHLYDVIANRTSRGRMLDEHPLFLIGADYNQAALKVSRNNLIQSDIWAKVIWGDIGRPDLLANDLREHYDLDLKQILNVRTFLDHNRIWEEPTTEAPRGPAHSTGAYAYHGRRLPNDLVERSLLLHFKKWAPYVQTFGLLVIELHTIAPELTAKNLGRTAATAYDATHGYSDQYILEVDEFLRLAREAGLVAQPQFQFKFPDNHLATVSINLFKGDETGT